MGDKIQDAVSAFNALDDHISQNFAADLGQLKPDAVTIDGVFDPASPTAVFTVTEELGDFYRVSTVELTSDATEGVRHKVLSSKVFEDGYLWNDDKSSDALAVNASADKFSFEPYKNYIIRYYFTPNHDLNPYDNLIWARDDWADYGQGAYAWLHYLQDEMGAFLSDQKKPKNESYDHAYLSNLLLNGDAVNIADLPWSESFVTLKLMEAVAAKLGTSHDNYLAYQNSIEKLKVRITGSQVPKVCFKGSLDRAALSAATEDPCVPLHAEVDKSYPDVTTGFFEDDSQTPSAPIDPYGAASMTQAFVGDGLSYAVQNFPQLIAEHPKVATALIKMAAGLGEDAEVIEALAQAVDVWGQTALNNGIWVGTQPVELGQVFTEAGDPAQKRKKIDIVNKALIDRYPDVVVTLIKMGAGLGNNPDVIRALAQTVDVWGKTVIDNGIWVDGQGNVFTEAGTDRTKIDLVGKDLIDEVIVRMVVAATDLATNPEAVSQINGVLNAWVGLIAQNGLWVDTNGNVVPVGDPTAARKIDLLDSNNQTLIEETLKAYVKAQLPEWYAELEPKIISLLPATTVKVIRVLDNTDVHKAGSDFARNATPYYASQVGPALLAATKALLKEKTFKDDLKNAVIDNLDLVADISTDPAVEELVDNLVSYGLPIIEKLADKNSKTLERLLGVTGVKILTGAMDTKNPDAMTAQAALVDTLLMLAEAHQEKLLGFIMKQDEVASIQGLLDQLLVILPKLDKYLVKKLKIKKAPVPETGAFRDQLEALVATIVNEPARWIEDGSPLFLDGFSSPPVTISATDQTPKTESEVQIFKLNEYGVNGSNEMTKDFLLEGKKAGEIAAKLKTNEFDRDDFRKAMTDYALHAKREVFLVGDPKSPTNIIFVIDDIRHGKRIVDKDGVEYTAEKNNAPASSDKTWRPYSDATYTLKSSDGSKVIEGVHKISYGLTEVALDTVLLAQDRSKEPTGYVDINDKQPVCTDPLSSNLCTSFTDTAQFDIYQFLNLGKGIITSDAISLKPMITDKTDFLMWKSARAIYATQIDQREHGFGGKDKSGHLPTYDVKISYGMWGFNENSAGEHELIYVVMASGIDIAYAFGPAKIAQNVADARDFILWHRAMREQYPELLKMLKGASQSIDQINHPWQK